MSKRYFGGILSATGPIIPLGPSLYAFTSATFTNGGQTGQIGPSLTQARDGLTGAGVDAWKNNTSFFNTTNGTQLWTVPRSGTYRITADGSQGCSNASGGGAIPGLGARIIGDFVLTQGEVIRILVGQRADQSAGCGGTGGGGGTFVIKAPYNTTGSILAIAGGGGGAGTSGSIYSGTGGSATNNGTASPNSPSGAGGSGGNGGGVPTTGCSGPEGAGGGGFSGNGSNALNNNIGGGQSFTNGGLGGAPNGGRAGGFGGGGAANGNGYGSGGGGGYSGGGGAGLSANCSCAVMGGGGGGGSFNSGTNQSNTGSFRTGAGQVTITFLA